MNTVDRKCEYICSHEEQSIPLPIIELLCLRLYIKFCQFHHCDEALTLCDWAPLILYQLIQFISFDVLSEVV